MGPEAGTRRKTVATLRPDGREEALSCIPLTTDPACYLCHLTWNPESVLSLTAVTANL